MMPQIISSVRVKAPDVVALWVHRLDSFDFCLRGRVCPCVNVDISASQSLNKYDADSVWELMQCDMSENRDNKHHLFNGEWISGL